MYARGVRGGGLGERERARARERERAREGSCNRVQISHGGNNICEADTDMHMRTQQAASNRNNVFNFVTSIRASS